MSARVGATRCASRSAASAAPGSPESAHAVAERINTSTSVECARIKLEVRDRCIIGPFSAEVRLNRKIGIFVLHIHGQLESLRHVVRIQLERLTSLAQCALEVAQV